MFMGKRLQLLREETAELAAENRALRQALETPRCVGAACPYRRGAEASAEERLAEKLIAQNGRAQNELAWKECAPAGRAQKQFAGRGAAKAPPFWQALSDAELAAQFANLFAYTGEAQSTSALAAGTGAAGYSGEGGLTDGGE